ncbi:hypothetical protein ACIPPS_04395 [Streptomyces sp. NPDC090127]|uniref:hypothetical protein n=1 Tax=Streptomyces sp. NPDC090127 TaxID=3365953 RepID=UPI003830D421
MLTRRRAVRTAMASAVVVVAALGSGCGIRTTSVPVDAGPGPSRVPCSVAGEESTSRSTGLPVRVYLVCGSQLEAVDRRSPLPEEKASGNPVATASALLTQLLSEPSENERQAGFSTAVKGPLVVTGGQQGDPVDTLRLSRQPEDLTPTALSQIVCTLAHSSAGVGAQSVVLGGPGRYAPRRYACTTDLRERPESAPPTLTLPAPSPS